MRDEMLTLPLPPLCQAALAALLEDKRLTETRVVELERRLDQACEAVRDAEDNAESLRVDLDRAETAARKAATDGTAGGTESLPAVDGAIFYSRVSDTRALSSLLLLLLLLLLFLLLFLLLLPPPSISMPLPMPGLTNPQGFVSDTSFKLVRRKCEPNFQPLYVLSFDDACVTPMLPRLLLYRYMSWYCNAQRFFFCLFVLWPADRNEWTAQNRKRRNAAAAMPPPSSKGKAKAQGGKGKGLANQKEDHSFDEVVTEHSKKLEELRERQKVLFLQSQKVEDGALLFTYICSSSMLPPENATTDSADTRWLRTAAAASILRLP